MSSKRSQSSVTTSVEAMNSYFGDFFEVAEPVASVVSDRVDVNNVGAGVPACPEFIFGNIIETDHWLVPTLSVGSKADQPQSQFAVVDCIVLWLSGLYLLRRPVTGKLRSYILEYCDEKVMKYHLIVSLMRSEPGAGL